MSIYDPTQVYRVPGRLALGTGGSPAFNFALPFPHGGAALGIQRDIVLENKLSTVEILDRAKGRAIGLVDDDGRWRIVFTLQQWDATAYALIYRVVSGSIRGSRGPGVRAAALPIVFSPYDPTHPAALLFNPGLWSRGPIPANPKAYFAIPVEGLALLDASNHDVQIDLLSNLSLT